jgi:hypothetical protein
MTRDRFTREMGEVVEKAYEMGMRISFALNGNGWRRIQIEKSVMRITHNVNFKDEERTAFNIKDVTANLDFLYIQTYEGLDFKIVYTQGDSE